MKFKGEVKLSIFDKQEDRKEKHLEAQKEQMAVGATENLGRPLI